MEYRLNKIDTDLRQKINDAAKAGKVHGAKSITVYNDEDKERREKQQEKIYKYKKLNKFKVDASKVENIQIEAFKERAESEQSTKGNYLDVKK